MAVVISFSALLEFPDELLLWIFRFLPALDFFRTLPLVCKRFLRLARDRVTIRARLRSLGHDFPAIYGNEEAEMATFSTERWYYVRYGRCLDLVQAFLTFDKKKLAKARTKLHYQKKKREKRKKRKRTEEEAGCRAKFLRIGVGKLLYKAMLDYYGLTGQRRVLDCVFLSILQDGGIVGVPEHDTFREQICTASFTIESRKSLAHLFGCIFPLRTSWLREKIEKLLPRKKSGVNPDASGFILTMTQHCFNRVCAALAPTAAPPFFPRLCKTRQRACGDAICDSMAACVTRLTNLLRVRHRQAVHLSPIFMQYYDPIMYEELRPCNHAAPNPCYHPSDPKQPVILFHRDLLTQRQDPGAIHDSGLNTPFTVLGIVAQIDLPYVIPLEQLQTIGAYRPEVLKMVKIKIFLNENDACTACVFENGKCHIMGATTYEQIRFAISELMKMLAPFMEKKSGE